MAAPATAAAIRKAICGISAVTIRGTSRDVLLYSARTSPFILVFNRFGPGMSALNRSEHPNRKSEAGLRRPRGHRMPHDALRSADLAMLRVRALRLGVRLAHVFTMLRLAVPLVGGAVVDLAIDPDHARSAAGRGVCRRRRHHVVRLHGGIRGRCGRSSGCRGGGRRAGGGVPLLHSLVPSAGTPLARRAGVTAILALAGRT